MTRSAALALLLVLGALTVVVAGAWRWLQRDREELVERFATERLRQVDEAAREIGAEMDEVASTLRFVGGLLQKDAGGEFPERELEALRAASGQYRILSVYDEQGKLVRRVGEPDAAGGVDPKVIVGALDDSVRAVLGNESGAIEASPVSVPGGKGWSRIFAANFVRPNGSRVEIAALLEMPRIFDKLHLLAGAGGRAFLIGGAGEPTAASDPVVAAAIGEAEDHGAARPGFADLLVRMRGGGRGNVTLSEVEAKKLGLGSALAIASYAAIHGEGAGRWSIATISSTEALRDHEQALVRRLSLAAGAVALLVMAFAGWLVVSSRRAAVLHERLRSAGELAHLHEKTEKILENVPTAVMALSEDGRITAANRALRERIGGDGEGPIGGDLSAAFPEAPAAVVARLSALVGAARASDKVKSLHGERLALFGEEGQYSIHAVPLEPRFPEARALLVIEDVSEVRSLAGQLLRAEKLATIGVLSAGIAHEIGTPLGVVRGRAEYILGKLGPGHTQAAGLAVIVEQIDRVSRTIRQLLDFARVKPASVSQVEVAPVARAVLELLGFEAERRHVELRADMPHDLALVMAEPDQLQQVLLNLTINAIDACEEGGHVTLSARAERSPTEGWERVRIEVADDGCGIPEEQRVQIFDPFFTTKKRGQGTGLGLTMAAEIARNHGAEIEVESEPGRGTRMILLWPTSPAPLAAAAVEA